MSRSRIVLIIASAVDLALGALPFAGIGRWDDGEVSAIENAAAAGAVIITICLLAPWLRGRSDKRFQAMASEYERREKALIRTFASLAHRDPTGPMPRLRAVDPGR